MRRIVLIATVVALLASGCRGDIHKEFYAGGVTPAEARKTMRTGDYDCVLLMNTDDCQHAVYGWTDSLHFTTHTIGDGSDTTVTDHAYTRRLADKGWHFKRLDDGRWKLQFKKVFAVKMSDVQVSTEGVEFRVSACGVPLAQCTFLTERPELSSTDLFALGDVRELLLYSLVDVLLDADLDDESI